MRLTRRGVLGAAALGVAAAVVPVGRRTLAQPPIPSRLPLGEFARDPKRVAALRRGVKAMRERPGSDPASWFWQAAVHAYSDEIYAEALKRDPKVAKVDARFWNQCPHFGQASANFLIWHRAYLYHFERILRAASGEPELAIPYWNYDEEGQRGFPELFAPQFLDRAKTEANPLYHPNRELAFVRGLFTLSEPVCAATRAREAPAFFSAPGTTGFGGDLLLEGIRPGALEQRPHNDLHVAVGGSIGSASGAMADVPTAAFDPVFFVHHANIDRLWRIWAASPGKAWGPLPPNSWFDEAPWTFIDSDGSEVGKPRRFYMEADNLPIAYADAATNGGLALPRAGTALAEAAPTRQGATQKLSSERNVLVSGGRPAASLAVASRPRPAGTRIRTGAARSAPTANTGIDPADLAGRGGGPAAASPPPPPGSAARRTLIVRLSGIAWDRLPANGFAVYLAPRGAALDESAPWFLGTLNLFGTAPPGHGRAALHQMPHMNYQDFDATRLVDRVETEALEVQIVPYSLFAPAAGQAAPRTEPVRIAEVSLLVRE